MVPGKGFTVGEMVRTKEVISYSPEGLIDLGNPGIKNKIYVCCRRRISRSLP
jgi:hypothetical protein